MERVDDEVALVYDALNATAGIRRYPWSEASDDGSPRTDNDFENEIKVRVRGGNAIPPRIAWIEGAFGGEEL